jgi:hypothetical protein
MSSSKARRSSNPTSVSAAADPESNTDGRTRIPLRHPDGQSNRHLGAKIEAYDICLEWTLPPDNYPGLEHWRGVVGSPSSPCDLPQRPASAPSAADVDITRKYLIQDDYRSYAE